MLIKYDLLAFVIFLLNINLTHANLPKLNERILKNVERFLTINKVNIVNICPIKQEEHSLDKEQLLQSCAKDLCGNPLDFPRSNFIDETFEKLISQKELDKYQNFQEMIEKIVSK